MARRVLRSLKLACACALLLAACGGEARPGLPPQHVVLVTFESARADRFSFALHRAPTSSVPADELARVEERAMGLDDLAQRGVVFARCFAPSPSTIASLATLHSGRSPLETAVASDDDVLPGEIATLAELLGAHGYHTAAFTHSRRGDLREALGQGFDTFDTLASDRSVVRAAARHWVEDQGDGARRFVWLHLCGPTPPFGESEFGEAVEALVAEKEFGRGLALPEDRGAALVERSSHGGPALSASEIDVLSASYDREVARATTGLALALRDAFDPFAGGDQSETWARTLFVFTSPSGVLLGEEGALGTGGSLHRAVLHVPLVLRHPDSLTGERVVADAVELQDVAPTLLDWLGIAPPRAMSGRSLLPLVDTYVDRPFEHRPAISVLKERVFSAADERFHLVWNPLRARPAERSKLSGPIPELALYELSRDPLERIDRSADHPSEVARLQEAIKRWRERQVVFPADKLPPRATAARDAGAQK